MARSRANYYGRYWGEVAAADVPSSDGEINGDQVFVTDAGVSGVMCFYDGTNWISTVSGKPVVADAVQALTASGAVNPGVERVELNHASVVIASTIADAKAHHGLFTIEDTSASGTAAHTCTLTSGTWDGTNTIATFNAPDEELTVYFDEEGNGRIILNTGSVALS